MLASSGALTSLWVRFLYEGIQPFQAESLARAQPFIARGFLLATLLAGGVLGLVWAVGRGRLPRVLWVLGVGVLLVLDVARVDDRFIQGFDFRRWAAADPNIRYLQERLATEDPFRVLAMGGSQPGQDVKPGMYGLELAGGHHPNDLARYRELIGMAGSGIPANLFEASTGAPNFPLLAILNVRYVIWPVYSFGGFPGGEAVMGTTLGDGRPYEAVYEIPTLPRARLVGEAVVLGEEETVGYLLSPSFRPDAEVVLNQDVSGALAGRVVEGEVEWLERTPNRLRLRVRADGPALLVLAENWYPAWKARVGDEETPVLRANHTLRAVPVPEGEHEVVVYYGAGPVRKALAVTLVSALLLGVVGGWGYLSPRRGGEAVAPS